MEEEQQSQKYSLVTGEKIKKKSIKKIEKKHKEKRIKEKKQNKKLSKKIKKVDKMLHVEEKPLDYVEPEEKTSQTKVLIVRKPDEEVPVTPKRKFLNFMSYVLVGLVAIFFGYFSGNFYVANVLNKVDYSIFSEEALLPDGYNEKIYTKFAAFIASGGTIGKNYSASELFISTKYLTSKLDSYYVAITGSINPKIASPQSVWGFKQKENGKFIYENISMGIISVGERVEYDPEQMVARCYKATKIDPAGTTYSTDPIEMSYEDYREEYGTDPTEPYCPYIINSEQTVLKESENVTSLGAEKYQLDFSLTTDSSVINYVKQVKHMSGLGSYPSFKQINVSAVIEFDKSRTGNELRFISIRFDESYSVQYFGVSASCSGFLENTFSY